ncbi:MAG TPA: hypothetical protein GXZ90_09330, partial [Clostridiales bacterium]|nr:hypothetical protein [Clostridiales bacterium]
MKRALRANIILIWAFVVVLVIAGITRGLNSGGMGTIIASTVSGAIALGIYYVPFIKDEVKGTLMSTIPAVMAILLSAQRGGDASLFNIYILTMVMQSLYFHKKMLSYYGISLISIIIILYFAAPGTIVSVDADLVTFVSPIAIMICTYVVLTLLTTWAQHELIISQNESIVSKEALDKIEKIFGEISKATVLLSKESEDGTNKMEKGKESAVNTSTAIGELSKSVESAADSVSNVRRSSYDSSKNIVRIYDIMESINDYFKETMEKVKESGIELGNVS